MLFSDLLKSKKFWTLISAIVAALAAFFLSSCSSAIRITRSGVHCDTVRTEYQARSKNYSSFNM